MIKRKISMKNKLLFYFGLIIITTIVAQLIFNLVLVEDMYVMYKMNYMEQAFEEIEENFNGRRDYLETMARELEAQENIQVIITYDGEIIYLTTAQMIIDLPSQISVEDSQWEDEYEVVQELYEDVEFVAYGDVIEFSECFTYDEHEIGVYLTHSINAIESSIHYFFGMNILIELLVLVVSLFVALKIAKNLTKPIVDIERICENISNLEFEEYASEDAGAKETSNMGISINRMSRELESKITELNTLNEQLEKEVLYHQQVEQVRKEFLANVSHEMKTPLAILQFYCDNLKSDIPGIDKEYYYNTIIEEIQRMDLMVKHLLQIGKLENEWEPMEMSEVHLSNTVKHVLEKTYPLLEGYKVMENIEGDIWVSGHSGYIQQAISNYIANAISHTKKGGEIIITLKLRENMARCSVYNEGDSIPEEHLERIWDSFYKSDKARVRLDNSNVGLGLYIVKSIVDNHQGVYGVENQKDGVTFYFELPLQANNESE